MNRLLKLLSWAGLLLFAAVVIGFNLYWIKLSYTMVYCDVGLHKTNALFIYRVLEGSENFWHYFFFTPSYSDECSLLHIGPVNFYPPLMYLLTAIVFMIGGPQPKLASASLQILVFIYILFLWLCANRLWGPRAAWAAVLIGATSPLLLSFSRIYMLSMSSAAMTCVCLYYFLGSKDFKESLDSQALGLALGLGALTRPNFAFYVFPLLLWGGYQVFRKLLKDRELRYPAGIILACLLTVSLMLIFLFAEIHIDWTWAKFVFALVLFYGFIAALDWGLLAWQKLKPAFKPLSNMVNSFSIAIVIASPWYIASCGKLDRKYNEISLPNLESLWYYLEALFNSYYLAPIFILVALFFYFREPKSRVQGALVGFSLLLCYLTLCFVVEYTDRYLIAALPYFVIATTFWLKNVPFKRYWYIWSLIGLLSLWQITGWVLVRNRAITFNYAAYEINNFYFRYPPLTWVKLTPLVSYLPREIESIPAKIVNKIYRLRGWEKTGIAILYDKQTPKDLEKEYWDYRIYKENLPYYVARIKDDDYMSLTVPTQVDRAKVKKLTWDFFIYSCSDPKNLPPVKTALKKDLGWQLKLLDIYPYENIKTLYLFAITKSGENSQ